MALQVELVSPERILHSGEAEMVVARTTDGEIAFLSGHAPFIGVLGIGVVRVIGADGSTVATAVHGGFVEVKDNKVTILSDIAELARDIDVERARAAQTRAEEALRSNADDEDANAALARAQVRIAVADLSRV